MAGMRIKWWKRLLQPRRGMRVSGRVEACDMVPESLPPRAVVLVGNPGNETWAVFNCPCRGHRLMLNLDSQQHPLWRITSYNPLSIWPSIHDSRWGRECHFFVRNWQIHLDSFDQETPTCQPYVTPRSTRTQPPLPPSTAPAFPQDPL